MFMDATKTIAALFDFDGVIMDTEPQYTIFWNEQGQKYLHKENFGPGIKGQTLAQMALSWILRDGDITSVLIGASKPSQILDNIGIAHATSFSDEERRKIEEILA